MPNALYSLLQVESLPADGGGLTTLPLGDHLRHPGGLRIASIGLAAEHGAAAFAFAEVMAVPLAISVGQRPGIDAGDALELISWMRHRGRSVMVTGMDGYRRGDRTRRVAFGTITWSVLGPRTEPPKATGVSTDRPEGTLLTVAGVILNATGAAIPSLTPGTTGPGGILHAGALQTLAEEAALRAVRDMSATPDQVWVSDAAFNFLRAARHGPFVARPRMIERAGPFCDVEIELVDQGDSNRVCALLIARVVAGRD